MERIPVGRKLYFTILAVFLVFAVAFIVFQQTREKQYKVDTLNLKLQDYNNRMHEAMIYLHYNSLSREKILDDYVKNHRFQGLRVTLINLKGKVFYDNISKDYEKMANHAHRPEVLQALSNGSGSAVDRISKTMNHDYFYSATYFPKDSIVIRSALPYNNSLAKSLQADQHYIWFAVGAIILLTLVLYRFIDRLGRNITKLRIFAWRADHNESLETEDLIEFPDDELGEIAERIIKIYKRLQNTRKEQNVLKRQLTQNIAHELKTPVASIQGYLETILDNPHISEDTKQQFLQRCYAQSERLTSLLRDISTLNRMDDAPNMTDFENVDIAEIVRNIQKETALQLEEKNMTFCNKLPEILSYKGNHSLLYSIFRNLTDNAIAYAGEGTEIVLSCKKSGNRLHFTFKDNGLGVPKQHLTRLFERFYRVDKGRSRAMGGTGLGLAIVKNAVLLHKGHISVANAPGGGLMFEFEL